MVRNGPALARHDVCDESRMCQAKLKSACTSLMLNVMAQTATIDKLSCQYQETTH